MPDIDATPGPPSPAARKAMRATAPGDDSILDILYGPPVTARAGSASAPAKTGAADPDSILDILHGPMPAAAGAGHGPAPWIDRLRPAEGMPAAAEADSILDILHGPAPAPEGGEAPRHDHYLGRLLDVPSDIAAVLMQGLRGLSRLPATIAREHEEARRLFATQTPSQRGYASGQRQAPVDLVRDFFDLVASPIKGPVRSMVARPLAENFVSDIDAAREQFYSLTPSQRGYASGRRIMEAPLAGDEPLESKVRRIEGLTDLALPGLGIVPYARLPGMARSTTLARGVEKLLSPSTIDSDAQLAEAMLRGEGGTAARETAATRAALDGYRLTINRLPEADRLDFIDRIEGGPARTAALPGELRNLAGEMRAQFQRRAARLQQLPKYAQLQFVTDYYPHMWKDPTAAQTFATNFAGASKQGSGASLHARTIPTVVDGIRAGLVPVTTDPVETTLRYVASMDRFIAAETVFDAAKQNGTIRFVKPTIVGASGHPQSYQVPAGWTAIEGRGATVIGGGRYFAPEGFARVYNNFLSRGFYDIGGKDYGSVYETLQRASNAITALELGLSGFHAVTMMNEAFISRLARGIHDVLGGAAVRDWRRAMRGAGAVAKAPAAPVTLFRKGWQAEKVYLGLTPGTPDMARVVNLLERAGGRGAGKAHARDYSFSASGASGNYVRAFRQGALKLQLLADKADITAHPVIGTARVAARHIGRFFETVAAPLFDYYIPRLKNGAFYETMHAWLEANPLASHDAQLAQARRIWDSIDNRFGELVSDNIFWNNLLKQTAQLAMRSYSWNLGTVREIGGGVKDLAQMGTTAAGALQHKLTPAKFAAPAGRAGDYWTPRAAYVIAMPIAVGTLNAVYQYLKTGQPPQSLDDLVAGRTGGESTIYVPRAKGIGRAVPSSEAERVMIPGYQKDVFGWYEDWWSEAANKVARLPTSVFEIARNRDWRGDPIVNPEATAPEWLKQYFKYVQDALTPISIKSALQGAPAGSALTRPEMLIGLKPAPSYLANPAGHDRLEHALNAQAQRRKQAGERRQERRYGGVE